MAIIIIHGTQGIGKSTHGSKLRARFKGLRVRDEWHPGVSLREGDIALTNCRPPFFVAGAKVISAADALKQISGGRQ
jgi:hypothetical protein